MLIILKPSDFIIESFFLPITDSFPVSVCFLKSNLATEVSNFMESLLVNKLPLMEKETNLKLFPTYTYWRMYTKFATLKKHQDRPSCEISVTVTLHSTGEKWPIRMGNNWIDIAPGDAVIYEGCDIEHERKEYDGDGHSQVFLHYVDQNGKNKDYKYDKRHGVGYPQVPRPLK